MSVTYQTPINYEAKVASAPYYNYSKILQNVGGAQVGWTATGSTISQFDLPAQVYNFSKSFLRFQVQLPAVANGNGNLAFTKMPPIRRVTLMNRSGRYICDIPNFQHYWTMTKNLITPQSEFINYPGVSATNVITAAPGAAGNFQNKGLNLFHNPSYATPIAAYAAGASLAGASIASIGLAQANDADVIFDLTTQGRNPWYNEQIMTTTLAGGANSQMSMNCELRFGKIAFSFFNVNRDFYSTEALQLWIEWEGWNNFCFQNTATISTLQAGLAAVAAPVLTNLGLYLAVEMNEGIRQTVMAKVSTGGLALTIPYSTIYIQGLGTNPSSSVVFKVNRGHGQRLLRVISAESNLNDPLGDSFVNRCNFFNSPITNANGYQCPMTQVFNTQLDSRRIQPEDLYVITGDDWKYNREKLKKTIFNNQNEYYTNCPVNIDDWSACEDLTEAPEKDLQECGLDLSAEKVWTKQIMSKAAFNCQTVVVVVCQKTLVSGPQGIMI